MTDPLILLVEDDAVIREATQLNLERNGFRVITASGGLTGMDLAVDAKPDIAVLDVMLPDLNGISLCRRIREELSVPVIMLSARDDPVDIVLGLEAGADDYVTKPFDSGVLVARIRSVLRRVESHSGTEKDIVTLGDLEIDRELVTVTRSGAEVALTPTEMKLLLVMVSVPRKSGLAPNCSRTSGITTGAAIRASSTFTFSDCARRSAPNRSEPSGGSATRWTTIGEIAGSRRQAPVHREAVVVSVEDRGGHHVRDCRRLDHAQYRDASNLFTQPRGCSTGGS